MQARIAAHLESQGLSVVSTADTATREAGKDLIARTPGSAELWVSVKGYPERSSHTQARHWFSHAIFDLVMYRDEDSDVTLAIGLPDGYSTYRNLVGRVTWLRKQLPFWVFWVSEDGQVRCEDPPKGAL